MTSDSATGGESSPVDALIADHNEVLQHLLETGQASFHATLEGTVPKVILLAAASWMEHRVRAILLDFFSETTAERTQVLEFIRRNAVEMKYHTFFDWRDRKPGKFFALFGPRMKALGAALYREDSDFAANYDAFLELGDLRNQLVHDNYASFTLEKTAAEVADLYERANRFVDRLPSLLRSNMSDDND